MKKEYAIILIVLLIVAGSIIFFYNDSGPKGKIYLTLTPNSYDSVTSLYAFDLKSKGLEKVYQSNRITITNKFSSDESLQAYAHLIDDGSFFGSMQIFIANADGTNERQITKSTTNFKRSPAWSPDGRSLAFVGLKAQESDKSVPDNWEVYEGDMSVPDNWGVYITDFEGNEKFISNGIFPMFSPKGKQLLMLKDDGLYLYDIDDYVNGQRVLNMIGGGAFYNMKVGLSDDGSMLAWANIDHGIIQLYNIHSWSPFNMSVFQTLDSNAFWPVFSPDNRYLVAQKVDLENNIPVNQRLVVYDLESFEEETVLDLTDYVQDQMFVDDWKS